MVAHFLDTKDIDVAKVVATSGNERFAQTPTWTRMESGEADYGGVRAWVHCEITARVQAGDSTVYVARAAKLHIERDVAPGEAGDTLVYHNRIWHRLG